MHLSFIILASFSFFLPAPFSFILQRPKVGASNIKKSGQGIEPSSTVALSIISFPMSSFPLWMVSQSYQCLSHHSLWRFISFIFSLLPPRFLWSERQKEKISKRKRQRDGKTRQTRPIFGRQPSPADKRDFRCPFLFFFIFLQRFARAIFSFIRLSLLFFILFFYFSIIFFFIVGPFLSISLAKEKMPNVIKENIMKKVLARK